MKFLKFLTIVLTICLFLSNVNANELDDLKGSLADINSQVTGAKITYEGAEASYIEAQKSSDDEEKINSSRIIFENAKNRLAALMQAQAVIQSRIDAMSTASSGSSSSQVILVSAPIDATVSTSIRLVNGWNTFSIPINVKMKSDHALINPNSAVWAYDGNTQTWDKDPDELTPGKGYYIRIDSLGSTIKFDEQGFRTDLDSAIKADNRWYFLGSSLPIEDINYSKYVIIVYELGVYKKNPNTIQSGQAFWAFRQK